MKRAGPPAIDYEDQFRNALVGVCITRRDGGFVAVNPAFARLFGYASPEAFMDAVRGSASLYAERGEHERALAALARDGEVRDFEAWMRRRDGELRWISGGLVALKGGLVQWAVLDRTDKRMGRERELALQRLEHLVTLRFGQARSLGEALQAAMRAICETERWEAARYLYVDEERGVLRAGESWCIPEPMRERYLEESRAMEYRPGQGLVGYVWKTGEPLWVPDIAVDARVARPALAAVHGMRGSVVCPVHAEGRTIGVLIFDSSEVREPDQHLLGTLAVIGGQIGLLVRRAQAEQALAASERRLRALIEHGSDAIALYDRGLRRVYRSGSAQRITGYTDDERLGGPLMDQVFEDDRPALQAMVDALLAASGSSASFRCRLLTKSGRLRWVEGVATNLFDEPAVGALVVNYRDIDERMRYESRIEHLASHDALTGLPNRALLRDRVGQAIAHARRTRGHVALMYVDLDQFKLVNDSWGHGAGDALLLEVGARLKATMRQGDTVARLGGDEFVVLLSSLAHADDCTVVAGKIAAALTRPVALEGRELQVSASIGIAMYPEDGADLEALLQCADAAMYRAKEAGRNGYQYYSAEMGAHARLRVELEAGLRQALERSELRLHWQPQVALGSGEVRGCEALLRWERPGRGLVSPAHFVPVAEENGLIVPIGEWALRAACREAAGWAAAGLGHIRVAVNLSARQFWQGSVVEAVRAALDESGLPPSCLEVEITESVVARDIDKVVHALEQLRRMGVSTAIDDFGTGYSSLAYLRSLPLQKLKIDRYFIHGIPGDREAAALVAEIIRLAHVLSLEVVAEGVETEAQAAFLREAGCENMQGFLFARPMPPAEFAELVRSGRRLVLAGTTA